MMMTTHGEVKGVNKYRSWPLYREGHHMPFRGCESWNSRRRIVPEDEAYFARKDLEAMDKEMLQDTHAFIATL